MFSFQDCCFALFLYLSALYPQALALLINFRVCENVGYKVRECWVQSSLVGKTTAHDRSLF